MDGSVACKFLCVFCFIYRYNSITFAVLKIFGIYPVSIDLLIIMQRGSQILSFMLLRNYVLMSSCPQLCFGLREARIIFPGGQWAIRRGSVHPMGDKKRERPSNG